MARVRHVWGIDIGQCAFKAMRCRLEGDQVVAEGFDYIEYPKILSQPEADPQELVREAMQQFLSRNSVRGDVIAMAVPGQSGLAKFFKPPPVDVKRIPDIVRYEAKQQIPFSLDEVIWDYQKMPGGQEVDGFAIDTEVGLFAMKREQVYRSMKPFDEADMELDLIQLAPLSIYNFVTYDLLTDLPDPDMYDADNPPESVVVLSVGTDATDLVVTNGFRVWQRSIPLGGNHFTKQLTRDLKLTFAKAEHLKRNARQAEDPKAVFQAMRPVFNDMVTEIQRSVGYFQGIDRKARIRGVVLLGNTMKLPGLQQYIAKNLGYEVIPFEKFKRLNSAALRPSPAFSDNMLAFGVCYGLCLQGLAKSQLSSNLLPREIATQRMVRAKKPWAVASVAALMLALVLNFVFNYRVWSNVQPEREEGNVSWKTVEKSIDSLDAKSKELEKQQGDRKAQLDFLVNVGHEVVGAGDRRLLWLEVLKAMEAALPWTEGVDPKEYVDYEKLPMGERKELYIEYVESEFFPDLKTWFTDPAREKYFELRRHLQETGQLNAEAAAEIAAAQAAAQAAAAAAPKKKKKAAGPSDLGIKGPEGPGWVIEMSGYHYYNLERTTAGATHLRNTLLKNLEQGTVKLPIDRAGNEAEFTMKELGIAFPILVRDEGSPRRMNIPNPDYTPPIGAAKAAPSSAGAMSAAGVAAAPNGEKKDEKPPVPAELEVLRYSFTVQFCWQERTLGERLRQREALAAQKAPTPGAQAPSPAGQLAESNSTAKQGS